MEIYVKHAPCGILPRREPQSELCAAGLSESANIWQAATTTTSTAQQNSDPLLPSVGDDAKPVGGLVRIICFFSPARRSIPCHPHSPDRVPSLLTFGKQPAYYDVGRQNSNLLPSVGDDARPVGGRVRIICIFSPLASATPRHLQHFRQTISMKKHRVRHSKFWQDFVSPLCAARFLRCQAPGDLRELRSFLK